MAMSGDDTSKPGGLGPATGADPRGPSSGDEPRSFAPARRGETSGVGQMRQDLGEDSGATDGDYDPGTAGALGGMAGDPAEGENTTSGTGGNSMGATGASASGDAHLGKDGRKLGEPMNAKRQVPSSGATGGLDGGSGAD
jgi:hypothetical protein